MSAPDDEEFFVGYLPTPPRTLRFSLAVMVGALALTLGLAAALAKGMGHAGRGYGGARAELVGVLSTSPYGVLWVADEDDAAQVHAVFLVRGWKVGLPASAAALDGHVVRASGQLMTRDGRRMLAIFSNLEDLEDERSALPPGVEPRLRARARRALGEVSLRGEIVDSKCQLGAMRPGTGRAHRACAQQCVAGGIPPVLVTTAASGERTLYLLVTAAGEAATLEVLDYLAEPVEVRGQLELEGDLPILHVDAIERL